MQSLKRFFSTSFGSAVAGGGVVLIVGLILIQAGAVNTNDNSSSSALVAPAALARPASDSSSKGLTVHDIYQRDGNGVAFIRSTIVQKTQSVFGFPQQQSSEATGSGFLIDNDGHILTNAHVVSGAQKVEVQLGSGGEQQAQVVGSDPSSDIALLKVDNTEGANPLPLGDSSKVEVGDPVVAIGNPFALDRTVTSGIVSALQRQIQAPNGFSISDVIQTDAAINPGNSGGPLIDGAGQVIGINSQIESQSGGNEGVGFAVPIKTAADVVSQLENGGQVHQAYLGISGGDITPEIAHALNLPVTQGVLIERVLSGGPADDAGIKGATGQATISGQTFPVGGDIITKVDGKPITGMDDVVSAVNDHKPGDEITLTVFSGSQQKDVTVKLGDRPNHVQDSNSSSLP
ncbi:MAG TPA: trypsin-like peptidase domain-containing protein [Solirubrobacterales bacterium]|jgi:S1-C subfamily serine protease|nr:trypsin-like peptidase domain-containing protein [Solirubrobacterales bacterium]